MPKLRASDQQNRERALMCALARASIDCGLNCDRDVADRLNISPRMFSYRKEQCFQKVSLSEFGRMARVLHLTGKEVCEALGVPYEEPEEDASA